MPIIPPRLDDRHFEDLVEELLARIPAHTPEWVPQAGDPGRTLLELFAWLGDTLLYRANLIPERQRLAFLKLLGKPMNPARSARGLISVQLDEPEAIDTITLAPGARVSGAVDFETASELTLLPVKGECYYKRPLTEDEASEMGDILDGLRAFHEIEGELSGYVTTSVFSEGLADKSGIDLIQDTTDKSLWIALIAASSDIVQNIKVAIAGTESGRPALLNIGLAPAIELPASLRDLRVPGRIPHVWEISTDRIENDQPVYLQLSRISDSTEDLTRRGVERYVLPGDSGNFGLLEGDVRVDANAGVGDRPPRLDDPEKLSRIVAWLRLRPSKILQSMSLSWVGINALEIDQRQSMTGRVIGISDGRADQVMQLPASSIEHETFQLQVEESGRGYVGWARVDDLLSKGRDDAVYMLDSEAGTLQFGDSVNGRIPEVGRRIRVAHMRSGGGLAGNLPKASLTKITAQDLQGKKIKRKLSIIQGMATGGGAEAETLSEAEKRIPSWLQHRNRSVTEHDYKTLAAETPGVRVGRIEVLSRFMPLQRRKEVPGVVSVMVLPSKARMEAPNPRPDQPFIEKVFSHLNARRPLATELYVIGCEYIQIGLSIGLNVREGFGHDQVVNNVRTALKCHLWSLPPGGPQAEGWPLGRAVQDRELEVIVARVSGVKTVGDVNLFKKENNTWRSIQREQICSPIQVNLEDWQLPELLTVLITTDGIASPDLRALPDPFAGGDQSGGGGISVPLVPEVC